MADISLYSNRYFEGKQKPWNNFQKIVISKYRQRLLERGANTIATLPRNFKSLPSFDGTNRVNGTDFFNCLSSCGLHIIKEDASLISRFIDKDGSNMLNFEEFLFVLRGRPNEERQAVIDYVYSIFDKDILEWLMLMKWGKFLIAKNILNLRWENYLKIKCFIFIWKISIIRLEWQLLKR